MPQRSIVESEDKKLIAELYPAMRRMLRWRVLSISNPMIWCRRPWCEHSASNDSPSWTTLWHTCAKPSSIWHRTIDGVWPGVGRPSRGLPKKRVCYLATPPTSRPFSIFLQGIGHILYLVEVEDVPYSEAARQLGMTTVAARQLASRARKKARLSLEVAGG